MLYATTTSRAQTCVHSALLLCSLKTKSHRAIMCNCNVQCATPNVQSLSSQYTLPSILLSGWIIVGSQQWPSEGNPSQEQLCLCYMCYYTPLVLLYTSDVLRTEGNLLQRGCIFAMCSYTPVIRNVLCAYMQCARWNLLRGLYVCYVLLHTRDVQCTLCFML